MNQPVNMEAQCSTFLQKSHPNLCIFVLHFKSFVSCKECQIMSEKIGGLVSCSRAFQQDTRLLRYLLLQGSNIGLVVTG